MLSLTQISRSKDWSSEIIVSVDEPTLLYRTDKVQHFLRSAHGKGGDDDIAATTAVAAIGAAFGDKGLTPKRHAPGSAIAAAHVNAADIGEL